MTPFELYRPGAEKTSLPDFKPLVDPATADTYLPSPALAEAVNVALLLGQPLLLTGEPGTGKTRLAWHITRSFDNLGPEPLVYEVQTSSVKKDLFYHYDALGHFRWAQDKEADPEADKAQKFIRYEALGKAILIAAREGRRSVVLIDELDKAPRDLPNDLLAAIESLRFDVPEVPGAKLEFKCPPELRPVIVITSNSERNLPEAFLRRVVYHHIEFPEPDALVAILKAKQIAFGPEDDPEAIVNHFCSLRKEKNLAKCPATAELIAWASLLPKLGFPTRKLAEVGNLGAEEKKLLYASYAVLAKTEEDLRKLK